MGIPLCGAGVHVPVYCLALSQVWRGVVFAHAFGLLVYLLPAVRVFSGRTAAAQHCGSFEDDWGLGAACALPRPAKRACRGKLCSRRCGELAARVFHRQFLLPGGQCGHALSSGDLPALLFPPELFADGALGFPGQPVHRTFAAYGAFVHISAALPAV